MAACFSEYVTFSSGKFYYYYSNYLFVFYNLKTYIIIQYYMAFGRLSYTIKKKRSRVEPVLLQTPPSPSLEAAAVLTAA